MSINWQDVPGWFDFQDIYDHAVHEAREGDSLVEVGTFLGRSALYMAEKIKESGKNLDFYVVDPWRRCEEIDWVFDPTRPEGAAIQAHGGSLFEAFAWYLEHSGLSDYIRVLRMRSEQAAKLFELNNLSFVFIDGSHIYENVVIDLDAWYSRLCGGALFAGHDYSQDWPGVVKAVDEFFEGYLPVQRWHNSWAVRIG
jgi:predicted O-methyltransferase YrrM